MTANLKLQILLFLAFVLGFILANFVTIIFAHGGDNSLIHACVKKNGGNLRIISPNETCTSSEDSLDWSSSATPNPSSNPKFFVVCPACAFPVSDNFNPVVDKLQGKDLSDSVLAGTNLGEGNLSDTNLSNAHLDTIVTDDGIFTNVNFSNSSLRQINFLRAILINTNFTNADLSNSNFIDSDTTGANFAGSTRTDVTWFNTICPDGTSSNDHGDTCEGHL